MGESTRTYEELVDWLVDTLMEKISTDDDGIEDTLEDWTVSNNIVDLSAMTGEIGQDFADEEYDTYRRWEAGLLARVYEKLGMRLIQDVPRLRAEEEGK